MADEKQPSVTVNCVEPLQADDHAAQAVAPQRWPTEPGLLVADHRYDIIMNVYDGFLCAIPLFLMVKTSLCIYAHHLDKDNRGDYIDRVSPLTIFLLKFNEQLVTAFTIIFITIMTTVVRRLALYKAQEGATVSDLEQLQASISLPSTIKMVFSLRKFTKFSAALIAVWSFYYLGSQSNKREYGYAPSDPYHHIRAVYPTDDAGYMVDFTANSSNIEWLNSQFRESMDYFIVNKNAITGVDLNGNVLVPRLDSWPWTYSKAIENSQWIHFQPSMVDYSTLAGRALSMEPQTAPDTGDDQSWKDSKIMGDYTFNTTFMDVQCESLKLYPEAAFPANVIPGMLTSINKTSLGSPSSSLVVIDVWSRWNESNFQLPNGSYPDLGPDFQFPIEINNSTSGSIKVTCNVTNPAVKLQVHCSEVACLAKAMQYLPQNVTEQSANPLADDDFAADFFSSLLLSYGPPDADGIYATGWGTVIEQRMGLYQLILAASSGRLNVTDLTDRTNFYNIINLWDLNNVLTQFINTYHNLALVDTVYEQTPGPDFGSVSVIGGLYDPHYALFWPWLAISYTSASILVAAAIFSFWLRRRTLAPDIFGYVSSLTRDDPHLLVTSAGSTMSGVERARYLQDVKIRIGDVYGQSGEVGKVGVTVVHHAAAIDPLRKGRKYF